MTVISVNAGRRAGDCVPAVGAGAGRRRGRVGGRRAGAAGGAAARRAAVRVAARAHGARLLLRARGEVRRQGGSRQARAGNARAHLVRRGPIALGASLRHESRVQRRLHAQL